MKKVVLISSHPDYKNSVANRALTDEFQRLVPGAEIVNLAALYPDYKIDVEAEQRRLLSADLIIFDFPFWWYGSTSLTHRYVEEVFAHGFAYGSTGTALHGKEFVMAFTVGAPAEAYSPDGFQHFTIEQFMPPFKAMANMCGLRWLEPVYDCGMMTAGPNAAELIPGVTAKAKAIAARLAALC